MSRMKQDAFPGWEELSEVAGIPSQKPVVDVPVFVTDLLPGVILVVRVQLYTEATGNEEGSGVKERPRSR